MERPRESRVDAGHPSLLDEETVRSLSEPGVRWATDPHQPLPEWQAVRKRPPWLAFLHRILRIPNR
jgi:hypothetical protein